MTGTDRYYFAISETGVAQPSPTPPDYESPADSGSDNVYEVTVVAQDDAFNSGGLDVVVTVTDVNEGPEVAGPPRTSPSPRTNSPTRSWPPTPPPTPRTRLPP